MDEGKLVFINLNKGKTGDINARLLGMIFLTKFTAAAMSRVDTPEDQRRPFTLYIDEFQNFLTDSVKTILSEARKYKLSVVMANQYVGQLTEEIKNAVFGNVGSLVSLRTGPEDADTLVKQFEPVFTADDLIKMPNLNGAVKMLVGGIPSNPFTMFIPFPEKKSNPEIAAALRRLSASKYARPKSEVEKEIYERMRDKAAEAGPGATAQAEIAQMKPKSFLDDFMAKKGVNPSGSGNTAQGTAPQPQPVAQQYIQPTPQAQPVAPPVPQQNSSLADGQTIDLSSNQQHEGEFSLR
jgi:hypothetical protein